MYIAILDLLSIAVLCVCIIMAVMLRSKVSKLINFLLLLFIGISCIYMGMMFIEWAGIMHSFENIENISGSLIPILFVIIMFSLIDADRAARLKINNERMELVLQGGELGTWDYDIPSDTLYTNEHWGQMLGYEIGEYGNSLGGFEALVHPDDHAGVELKLQEHLSNSTPFFDHEFRMRTKTGDWHWIQSRGKVMARASDGNALRIAGTHLDISARKEMEEQLKLRNEEYLTANEELTESIESIQNMNIELAIARDKAEESDRLKSAFLANLSHEIRTPMNGILGFAELLKQENLTEKIQQDYIKMISQSGQRMVTLIEDLVDIARIEAGQIEIKNQKTDLRKLLESVYSFFVTGAYPGQVQIVLDMLPSKTDSLVLIDSVRLEQVLFNLIKNALKFTKEGQVEFGCSVKGADMLFHVKDTGCGIAPNMYEHIFERFRQLENRPFRSDDGCGLGLAISKAFVELMGGKIWVESVEGVGSNFFVSLPFRRVSNTELPVNAGAKKKIQLHAGNVLVAEDDLVSFMLLNEILTAQGMHVLHAVNGAEAIELASAHPDLCIILMDIKMPVMNGIEAVKAIRKFNSAIPIIAQTAYVADNDYDLALSAGCNDVIPKPIDPFLLIKKMDALL